MVKQSVPPKRRDRAEIALRRRDVVGMVRRGLGGGCGLSACPFRATFCAAALPTRCVGRPEDDTQTSRGRSRGDVNLPFRRSASEASVAPLQAQSMPETEPITPLKTPTGSRSIEMDLKFGKCRALERGALPLACIAPRDTSVFIRQPCRPRSPRPRSAETSPDDAGGAPGAWRVRVRAAPAGLAASRKRSHSSSPSPWHSSSPRAMGSGCSWWSEISGSADAAA